MYRFSLLLALAFIVLTSATGSSKWKSLFDGKTLAGWHTYGKTTAGNCWQVDNKTIHLVPTNDKANQGDLVTDSEYDNFELELEWKVAPESNSGIIFLLHEDPAVYKYSYMSGPEMQVLDNIGAEDNKKENHLAGTLYDLAGNAVDSKPKPVGEWNKSRIVCNRGSLQLYLNGTRVVSATLWDESWKQAINNSKFKTMTGFGTYRKGKIALQYHGHDVWYRNIRLKAL